MIKKSKRYFSLKMEINLATQTYYKPCFHSKNPEFSIKLFISHTKPLFKVIAEVYIHKHIVNIVYIELYTIYVKTSRN